MFVRDEQIDPPERARPGRPAKVSVDAKARKLHWHRRWETKIYLRLDTIGRRFLQSHDSTDLKYTQKMEQNILKAKRLSN